MKKLLFLLTIFGFVSGCSSTSEIVNSNEADFSYLALGDSYTIGESVPEEQRWPVQLSEQLRARGYKMAAPKIIAKTGWTTGNLLDAIETEINVQRDFDLVSILIGVNNQYQNKSISDYETELNELFRKAINHSRTREKGVFALSIPDYGATPFGEENSEIIGREIDAFNAVFRKVAETYNVAFFNITPISREAKTNPELTADDKLHPSGLMYTYWVDLIIDEVAKKLPEK
ncbi:SGNH/GDSL hydrolase family protein [Gillisia limnaea]|uniref:Lipolytic protein G-D-S-L family n=1 Tax=Gillisia limnaea (strain DSM 15749 / LMG 21470 / R-8282) TaxID=865937 RepID=H2BUL8_GILLR|nr:SGNH/GDSL hydrolase family protein [Gillisia limnaea]EHQ01673.1 lipolytic protein G-D-S-L family [Gillisia limnaea DSM 15749]